MKNGLRYLIFLALSAALLAGCAGAPTDGTEEVQEAAAFPEKSAIKRGLRQEPGEREENEGAEQNEASEQSAASVLLVTDHRINSAKPVEYASREAFLREYGFEGQEPFYEYTPENGGLQLELYYNNSRSLGCGIRYYPETGEEPAGFLFNGSGNYRYYLDFLGGAGVETGPYTTLSFGGSDGKDEAEDYEEAVEYREDGRLSHFVSQGWIPWLNEKKELQKLLDIELFYREDGTLRERNYWHNDMVFGTWYSARQGFYDQQERLLHEHCYVTHGSVDFYYIYEDDGDTPLYCLIIDNNLNLLCAELLEYHGTGTELFYDRIGPALAGETENRYAEAVIAAVEGEGKEHDGYVTHTYAADYDGDGLEEAFVIFGREIDDEYDYEMTGDCWFVSSQLEVSPCVDWACAFYMWQQFICQEGKTYLVLPYSIGFPWRAGIYTVRDNAPAETSGCLANKYIDRDGHVILIENAYDGTCWITDVSAKGDGTDLRQLWSGHSWKPYTFLFDQGELREIPAREVTREEVERLAPLPDSWKEPDGVSAMQFILRDNGELNINMAVERDWDSEERCVDFSYITYRLNEDSQWEYVEEQIGYYEVQFGGGKRWDYIEELYK